MTFLGCHFLPEEDDDVRGLEVYIRLLNKHIKLVVREVNSVAVYYGTLVEVSDTELLLKADSGAIIVIRREDAIKGEELEGN